MEAQEQEEETIFRVHQQKATGRQAAADDMKKMIQTAVVNATQRKKAQTAFELC